ncbi:MAG: hypothetical protein M1835_000271 [Candelina submexicana]|nr:MAG: hypothetical protein M1835_000271 [Candelina submexicana]
MFVRNATEWDGKDYSAGVVKQLDQNWTYASCAVTLTFNNLQPPPMDYNTLNGLLGANPGDKPQSPQTVAWSEVVDAAGQVNSNCTEAKGSGGRVILGALGELSLSLVSSVDPSVSSRYDRAFTTCLSYAQKQLFGSFHNKEHQAYFFLKKIVEDPDQPKPVLIDDAVFIKGMMFPGSGDSGNGNSVRMCKSDGDCVTQCGMECAAMKKLGGTLAYGGSELVEVGGCAVKADGPSLVARSGSMEGRSWVA